MGRKFGNIVLTLFALAIVAYFGAQAQSLWQSFFYEAAAERAVVHAFASPYGGMSGPEVGEAVLRAQGCLACHQLGLEGGILAPSLDNVGVRRANADWLKDQIEEPDSLFPGTYMPAYAHLSGEELDGLIAFMRTLTPQRESPANTGAASLEVPERFSPAEVERGRQLFLDQGCTGCHAINGVAPGGNLGPNLTREGRRGRSDEWQLRHLVDPLSVYVGGEGEASWPMPAYDKLSAQELRALVAFLQSLK